MRTTPISVRVSDRDAEFIARLQIPGAATPSDKLRAIIAEARTRHEARHDFAAALALVEALLGPVRTAVRHAEHQNRIHSELVAAVCDWLPEAMATLVGQAANLPTADDGGTSVDVHRAVADAGDAASQDADPGRAAANHRRLMQLEHALADRVFLLIDRVMRLGVTASAHCYDPDVIAQRLEPLLEIARLIDSRKRGDRSTADNQNSPTTNPRSTS